MNLSAFPGIFKSFDDIISTVEFGALGRSREHMKSGFVPCNDDHRFSRLQYSRSFFRQQFSRCEPDELIIQQGLKDHSIHSSAVVE
jgi:hypothetical protein